MQISIEPSDEEAVDRVLGGELSLYGVLVRRYNQRLYRVARAILQSDSEAEDVAQQAFSQAFEHLHQLKNRAGFATWVTSIAVHDSLRRRRRKHFESVQDMEAVSMRATEQQNPELQASVTELRAILEAAIDALPEPYRLVLVMRDVEGMSTAETAASVGTTQVNVKVRLSRARALLRRKLYEPTGRKVPDAFRLHLPRCDEITRRVSEQIGVALRA